MQKPQNCDVRSGGGEFRKTKDGDEDPSNMMCYCRDSFGVWDGVTCRTGLVAAIGVGDGIRGVFGHGGEWRSQRKELSSSGEI